MNLIISAAAVSSATLVPAQADERDPVIALCDRYYEVLEEIRAHSDKNKEIWQRVFAEMPLPDPSIVHGPDAEKLGIPADRWPNEWPNGVIRPADIEKAIAPVWPRKGHNGHGKFTGWIPRTIEEIAKFEKLAPMWELSKEYFAEMRRRFEAYGGDDSDEWTDERADLLHVIMRAIRIRSSKTLAGLQAKIELCKVDMRQSWDCDEHLVESIFRDTERLIANTHH